MKVPVVCQISTVTTYGGAVHARSSRCSNACRSSGLTARSARSVLIVFFSRYHLVKADVPSGAGN